ncbi:hypothetical protein ABZU76_31235 [Amycolatopsis sp. NPDC005232]
MANSVHGEDQAVDGDRVNFRLLVESSQTTNMKLNDVATWLVGHRRGL